MYACVCVCVEKDKKEGGGGLLRNEMGEEEKYNR